MNSRICSTRASYGRPRNLTQSLRVPEVIICCGSMGGSCGIGGVGSTTCCFGSIALFKTCKSIRTYLVLFLVFKVNFNYSCNLYLPAAPQQLYFEKVLYSGSQCNLCVYLMPSQHLPPLQKGRMHRQLPYHLVFLQTKRHLLHPIHGRAFALTKRSPTVKSNT